YRAGDQRRFFIPCPECDTWQPLDWEKNIERYADTLLRVCVRCRESLEDVIVSAWDQAGVGEWRATNPDGRHHSYHLSRLYGPSADLEEIEEAVTSSNETTAREGTNQYLGLPYAPVGGQLSIEELQRCCVAPFTFGEVAGIQGC